MLITPPCNPIKSLGFNVLRFWRNNHLTELTWPNEYDWTMTTTNLNNWIWPKLTPTNLLKPTNLNFTSEVLLISVPDVFFLVEERSEAGQVSQPVRAWESGLGDLSKPTAPAYFFGRMFVGVMNFGQIQKIRFVVANIFWSHSNNNVCRCEHFSVIFK